MAYGAIPGPHTGRHPHNENLETKPRPTRTRAARIGLQPGASCTSPCTDGRTTGSHSNAPEAGKLEELVSPHRNCRSEKKSRNSPGKAAPMTRRARDLSNERFGHWIAIERSRGAQTMWLCRCTACGEIRSVRATSLTTGRSRSCGCRRRDIGIVSMDDRREPAQDECSAHLPHEMVGT